MQLFAAYAQHTPVVYRHKLVYHLKVQLAGIFVEMIVCPYLSVAIDERLRLHDQQAMWHQFSCCTSHHVGMCL